jgi:hypothetical protein
MIPSKFTITNKLPDKPADPGLHYFINSSSDVNVDTFRTILTKIDSLSHPIGELRAASYLSSVHFDKQPLTLESQRLLINNGYNYVGPLGVWSSPTIYGARVQGSDFGISTITAMVKIMVEVLDLMNIHNTSIINAVNYDMLCSAIVSLLFKMRTNAELVTVQTYRSVTDKLLVSKISMPLDYRKELTFSVGSGITRLFMVSGHLRELIDGAKLLFPDYFSNDQSKYEPYPDWLTTFQDPNKMSNGQLVCAWL